MDSEQGRATDIAVRLLSQREHSVAELLRKLAQRGIDQAVAQQCIDELASKGLQSDDRFTEAFVRSRIGRGQGPLKIKAQLYQRGIDPTMADQAILCSEVDWDELASKVVQKKFAVIDDQTSEMRGLRFLAQRGFTSEQARSAIGALRKI
ncbi:MAG: regulatory protein RecX [Lysobacteraceae bacterium]|nr:MAG: regulatory protein RecX [Xanthomonadaceae bacterium]